MKALFFLLLLLFPAAVLGANVPIGVNDIILGMNRGELMRKLAQQGPFSCLSRTCTQEFAFNGVAVEGTFLLEGNVANPADARVWEIRLTFDEHRFEPLKGALVGKYGSPSRSAKVTFRRQDGRQKLRETTLWYMRDGEIKITNIEATGATGGKGAITMTLTRPVSRPEEQGSGK